MRRYPLPALGAAVLLAAAPLARAADTPQKTYEHAVDCTSHVMALQAAAAHEDAKGAAEAPKLDAAVKRMHDEAVAAGAAVSVPADRVSLQIVQGRDRLMKTLDQSDPAKLKQARQEIGLTAISCMLDEAKTSLAARKAKPLAPAAK